MRSRRILAVVLGTALISSLFALVGPAAHAETVFVSRFGQTEGANNLGEPGDVDVGPDGDIYVTDTSNHRIQKYDNKGNYLMTMGTGYGTAPGQLEYPEALAIDEDGSFLYVTDTANSRIQVFDASSGESVQTFGKPGQGDGELNYPSGIAVYNGDVYVADSRNHRVEVFTTSGIFVKTFGTEGTGNGQFAVPFGIGVSSDGIFVTDDYWHTLQQFDLDGAFVRKIAGNGTGPGQLTTAEQLAVCQVTSSQGPVTYVYVVDEGAQLVDVFLDDGADGPGFLYTLSGTAAEGSHFSYPRGVGCSRDLDKSPDIAVASTNEGLIYHYKFGLPTVKVDPYQDPKRLVRKESLSFEISQNGMTGDCILDSARGTITIDEIGVADDTFRVHGPPTKIKPQTVRTYEIPIDSRPLKLIRRAFDKNRKLKVEVDFNFGCTNKVVRSRYEIFPT